MRVVVNAAMSVDGKLATRRREQLRISGPADFARVDRLRSEVDAVMVGVETVLADDPSLTVDDLDGLEDTESPRPAAQPARVVADSRGRTPTDARVLDDRARSFVLVADAASEDAVAALEATGAEVVRAGDDRVELAAALAELETRGIDSVLAEGGGELLFSLFEAGLVDELSVYVGSFVIGGRDAPTLADGEGFVDGFPSLELTGVEQLDDGVLLRYTVPAE
ncbi:MAG: 2,5-diamino-6-(ribosylamino)-4(3H)-pyrimidinone 5'-phosphate reductase [Halobacteriales archaeon]|nr:2,5-diamino-6-(ribosylamino)-4(3H)-pyrimidinone 5'-phosphate reductase [Halobacteriales archaeon]